MELALTSSLVEFLHAHDVCGGVCKCTTTHLSGVHHQQCREEGEICKCPECTSTQQDPTSKAVSTPNDMQLYYKPAQ